MSVTISNQFVKSKFSFQMFWVFKILFKNSFFFSKDILNLNLIILVSAKNKSFLLHAYYLLVNAAGSC